MKRIIGLIFGFTGLAVLAICMILASYRTAPLAAVALGGFYVSLIGFFISNLKK